jgi:ubiquinone/menaquinone biosynthesis C-methylase UbiE
VTEKQLFDEWPERYNIWFTTPIGKLVKETEQELVDELLDPKPGETILDAGCGTGTFTLDFLEAGARVTGLDISRNMLGTAVKATVGYPFSAIEGDMLYLPFRDNSFDKTVSVTALEFIADAQKAVNEMFRITRPGGLVVVATLNSLSPWAERRDAKSEKHILEDAYYRSPTDLLGLSLLKGAVKTVVHFRKDDDPAEAVKIEKSGQAEGLDTGAFAAVRWQKSLS